MGGVKFAFTWPYLFSLSPNTGPLFFFSRFAIGKVLYFAAEISLFLTLMGE